MEITKIKNHTFLNAPLSFCGLWALYYIIVFLLGYLRTPFAKLINLVPFLFFAAIASGFYMLGKSYKKEPKMRIFILAPAILIAVDQVVKALIRAFVPLDTTVHLLFDWIYFRPMLNAKGSWFASWFNLPVLPVFFTILNCLLIPLLIECYRFYIAHNGKTYWNVLGAVFIAAGAVCSLIDKLIFSGSLDFFMLEGLFVADTKDFYLIFGFGAMLTEFSLQNRWKQIAHSKPTDNTRLVKEFLAFCRDDVKRWFHIPKQPKDKS